MYEHYRIISYEKTTLQSLNCFCCYDSDNAILSVMGFSVINVKWYDKNLSWK